MNIQLQSIARQKSDNSIREEVFYAEVTINEGLQGDISQHVSNGEVAVLSKESWIKVCHETESDLPWHALGSSLLIKGFEFLPTDIGKTLVIGEAHLEITREMSPSETLANQAPELFQALQFGGRCGVVCRVLKSGSIQSGDEVNIAG